MLAEENGLTDADAALEAGALLRVPNEVLSLSNSASSFKPFDASDSIGDTTPTQPFPKPKKKGCGVLGQILIVVVAIVATVITAGIAAPGAASVTGGIWATGTGVLSGGAIGTAVGAGTAISAGAAFGAAVVGGAVGSAVSQGVAIGIGLQDSFDWKGVALAGIGAGVGSALGMSDSWRNFLKGFDFAAGAVRAAGTSALTQGVGVLVDVQESFSWRNVAAAALAAPVAGAVGAQFAEGSFAGLFASGVAGSLVRSAVGGKIDAVSVLVDAFGNALGNSIVDRMQPTPVSRPNGIGLTDEQYADMNRLVEEGYLASQRKKGDRFISPGEPEISTAAEK